MKNLLTKSLSVVFLAFLLASCDDSGKKYVGLEPEQIKEKNFNGEKKIYTPEGKLRTIAEYKNGKVDGRVRKFFDDGKIYMDATYQNGLKNGKCTYYYTNGKPYTVTDYVNGYKEGVEKTYYQEGGLMAVANFRKNIIQPGLQEYKKDGKPIPVNTTIIISEVNHVRLDGTFRVQMRLSDKSVTPKFYIMEQSAPDKRQKVNMSNGTGTLVLNFNASSFVMKKLIIEAEYKTYRGNLMKIRKPYNLAIDL
ncbi:MAG TPA: hypothetical protein PLJ84_08905 [Bacteroidales bacterium]|nr:hypothetical protein [Bacteroidales bacterium]HPT02707.1 hypothetical protein [Bacteroidales bacterium]